MKKDDQSVAVLIPCLNEEKTIAHVICDFKHYLPDARIYVFDNNSTDKTSEIALKYGADVVFEPKQGKGNVVRSMFRKVDADIYVLVDGDATYLGKDVAELLLPVISNRADLAIGDRISLKIYDLQNDRRFHGFGNRLVCWLINHLYNCDLKDVMSGYRVMNRFFVKNFPVMSEGFEIETEMTLHALDKRFRLEEIPIEYKKRPEGSVSKLDTFSDGYRVLRSIIILAKDYKPFQFFGICSIFLALIGLLIGLPPIWEYYKFNYVYKVPSAILAASLEILASLFFCSGLILETIIRYYKEQYELHLNKGWEFLNNRD